MLSDGPDGLDIDLDRNHPMRLPNVFHARRGATLLLERVVSIRCREHSVETRQKQQPSDGGSKRSMLTHVRSLESAKFKGRRAQGAAAASE